MPLQKILFKPGVNRENTRYTTEGGWYECDKVRFRQGTPEKIGGWQRISGDTFLGVCRSLWNWVTLSAQNLLGVGTNKKFYIEDGGAYYDITPYRVMNTLSNPFATTSGLATVVVTDSNGGFADGDYVTFNNASAVGGLTISGTYVLTYITATTYSITAASTASSTVAAGGGTVYATYQVNTGPEYQVPQLGWGAGAWGAGAWGVGSPALTPMTLWNQTNFGEDLLYGQRRGPLYYWDATIGYKPLDCTITEANPGVLTCSALTFVDGQALVLNTTGSLPTNILPGTVYYVVNASGSTCNLAATPGGAAIDTTGAIASGVPTLSPRGVNIADLDGASDAPVAQTYFLVSDQSRFVICFGTNDIGSTEIDPMLIRWSDQESVVNWTPAVTNQAGSIRLSHGSRIVTAQQNRQEILVWTDASLYSMQYQGPPYVWGTQLLADNISLVGPNAAALASGVTYWMGVDKFYKYDGRVQTLRCDLRKFIFDDINTEQYDQVYAGTNEGFNEVWWFYCTSGSYTVDRYVIYNYLEDTWYYGTMARTAWLDTALRNYPIAATYNNNLVNHEQGVDDWVGSYPVAINAYITSSQFDIGDGHNFGFVWRMLPDITFVGSSNSSVPQVTMTLEPFKNSGTGENVPPSVGGQASANVARVGSYVVDQFTGQVYTRVRGRQMSFRVESTDLGNAWQLGAPRIDIRPDGRR